jgi:curved DNA-binding protein CbpA
MVFFEDGHYNELKHLKTKEKYIEFIYTYLTGKSPPSPPPPPPKTKTPPPPKPAATSLCECGDPLKTFRGQLLLPEKGLITKEDISKAWKKCSMKCHPDKNPDNIAFANDRMKAVNTARRVLIEQLEREEGIKPNARTPTPPAKPKTPPPPPRPKTPPPSSKRNRNWGEWFGFKKREKSTSTQRIRKEYKEELKREKENMDKWEQERFSSEKFKDRQAHQQRVNKEEKEAAERMRKAEEAEREKERERMAERIRERERMRKAEEARAREQAEWERKVREEKEAREKEAERVRKAREESERVRKAREESERVRKDEQKVRKQKSPSSSTKRVCPPRCPNGFHCKKSVCTRVSTRTKR